jgi:hypothetical protein
MPRDGAATPAMADMREAGGDGMVSRRFPLDQIGAALEAGA